MSIESGSEPSALENLSALADGEVDFAGAARACASWRDDVSTRFTWHTYQLIGDVLRSDDLACASARDAAFLLGVRERLADEPKVLAPDGASRPTFGTQPDAVHATGNGSRSTRWSWKASSAVAAGFVLVAGAVMVTRSPAPAGGEPAVAIVAQESAAGAQPVKAPATATADNVAEPQFVVVDGKLIRDARLDRYLAAHKQFAGTSVLGGPSGFLRNAAVEAPNR